VRSALLEVPGVTRVQVSLEAGEVIVTYDPRAAKVEQFVETLNQAAGPIATPQYRADVKEGSPASPR
jgi:copper chaperone CopZ